MTRDLLLEIFSITTWKILKCRLIYFKSSKFHAISELSKYVLNILSNIVETNLQTNLQNSLKNYSLNNLAEDGFKKPKRLGHEGRLFFNAKISYLS